MSRASDMVILNSSGELQDRGKMIVGRKQLDKYQEHKETEKAE